jgi:hypothetical protein
LKSKGSGSQFDSNVVLSTPREEALAGAVVATVRLEVHATYDNGIPALPH